MWPRLVYFLGFPRFLAVLYMWTIISGYRYLSLLSPKRLRRTGGEHITSWAVSAVYLGFLSSGPLRQHSSAVLPWFYFCPRIVNVLALSPHICCYSLLTSALMAASHRALATPWCYMGFGRCRPCCRGGGVFLVALHIGIAWASLCATKSFCVLALGNESLLVSLFDSTACGALLLPVPSCVMVPVSNFRHFAQHSTIHAHAHHHRNSKHPSIAATYFLITRR